MPKGGARINSGPPPDPNALSRNRPSDKDGWTLLPASGRAGDPPAWPFDGWSDRELRVWGDIWATPQAVAWSRMNWTHDVAMYVRHLCAAEQGSLDDAKEARQWSDRLGLNPAAMLRNRWRISTDGPAPVLGSTKTRVSRERFRVVTNDAGA